MPKTRLGCWEFQQIGTNDTWELKLCLEQVRWGPATAQVCKTV